MSHTLFLHELRQAELECALQYFPRSGDAKNSTKVLEVGAGTGYQAAFLSKAGFDVLAVDMANSAYRNERIYPITEYDGRILPADSNSRDVVFSSNVLEHVRDIGPFLDEMLRVMAAGGCSIHILPTPTWRLWTILTHYIWLAKRLWKFLLRPFTKGNDGTGHPRVPDTWRQVIGTFIPLRHGERGVTLSEMYFYRKRWWVRQFEAHGYRVVGTHPAGIFYTGGFALGSKLSIARRRQLAHVFGSSCRIYILAAKG
jgi:SAM-dependent methyltransferase